MIKLQYKCTLESDVILNQKAATTGPNSTLDFIPGSNFLGIVAVSLYQGEKPDYSIAYKILHSGRVRFGDAHPSIDTTDSTNLVRGLHVPASMYYPKLEKPYNNCYIHHHIKNLEELNHLQLKQCRSGYYDFSNMESKPIDIRKTYTIKSAYDYETRRSKDDHMFGYESLNKGLVLLFDIEIDDEESLNVIEQALHDGIYRIGRSRTAQYGQVKIEKCSYFEIESEKMQGNTATVYADSRLIFINENTGMPTFRPTSEQLGFPKEAKILWDKCQIRTFQYAPFNYKRQCFDTDRCGIEKGSVFVVQTNSCPDTSQYIGYYQNEGFGKVIYNPAFLSADDKGKALYKIQPSTTAAPPTMKELNAGDSSLMQYINKQHILNTNIATVYRLVNIWIEKNKTFFTKGEKFASQWNSIRAIATEGDTKDEIMNAIIKDYTSHGVAKEKWDKKGRREKLRTFFNNNEINDDNVQMAVINLAAEMAKECNQEDN